MPFNTNCYSEKILSDSCISARINWAQLYYTVLSTRGTISTCWCFLSEFFTMLKYWTNQPKMIFFFSEPCLKETMAWHNVWTSQHDLFKHHGLFSAVFQRMWVIYHCGRRKEEREDGRERGEYADLCKEQQILLGTCLTTVGQHIKL